MSAGLVSVIIPCFNAASWIRQTIDCVLQQTYSNLEIIAIDDGSTDSTWAILTTISDERLSLIRQANQGASAARNAGLAEAMGHYVQYLDADDLMAPDKIEQQVRLSEEKGPGWVIASQWGRFRCDPAFTRWEPLWKRSIDGGIDWLIHAWSSGIMMPPHGWLVPAGIATKAGPWNIECSNNDDGEYFCRVLLAADGLVQSSLSKVYYRVGNANSYSQRHDRRSWESLLYSYELYAHHLLAVEDSSRARNAIASLVAKYQYLAYPDHPVLVARAEILTKSLGATAIRPHGGGRISRLVASLFGWRLTRRMAILFEHQQNKRGAELLP